MYITLTNIQNGQAISLPRCIENQRGLYEIALCELTYYPEWYNISKALGNNKMMIDIDVITIPDGYYTIYELDRTIFKPRGATLKQNGRTGRLEITKTSNNKIFAILEGLRQTLGFSQSQSVIKTREARANNPHNLTINREIFVHLDELSTSKNIHNGVPSTMLRCVPIEHVRRGDDDVTKDFINMQYKQLKADLIPQITVRILDAQGSPINISYLSLILHLRLCNTHTCTYT